MKTLISLLIFILLMLIYVSPQSNVELAQVPIIEPYNEGIEIQKKKQQIELLKSEVKLLQSEIKFAISKSD